VIEAEQRNDDAWRRRNGLEDLTFLPLARVGKEAISEVRRQNGREKRKQPEPPNGSDRGAGQAYGKLVEDSQP